jgi:hypothetical protein
MKPLNLTITAAVLILAAITCGGGSDEEASPSQGTRVDEFPLIRGPVSPDGAQAVFGTPDLGVGENRFGFVLTSATQMLRGPAATVSSLYFPDDDSEGQPKQTALAVFRLWPYGTRGLYTTTLNFDRPGRWGIEVNTVDQDGAPRTAELFFEVNESTSAPSVGAPAVPTKNRTIRDVESITQLTTGWTKDPDLYQISIADAVANGLPTVIVMASPAFCTNEVCGPQVEVLQELKNKYKGRANFIHQDFYDNPEEIQGDLSRARLATAVVEWGLPSTEWTFVVNADGIVSARFESFATLEEIEEALLKVL